MEQKQKNNKPARRKSSLDHATMVYGKVPPQARDIEVAILGGLMLGKNTIDTVFELLRPESFYVEAHQKVFAAIMTLHTRSQPIDILTVTEELKRTEDLEMVGGAYFVTQLTNNVVSDAHAEFYSRIVFQAWAKRELIRIGGELIAEAYEDTGDIVDMIDNLEASVYSIVNALYKKHYSGLDNHIVKAYQTIEAGRHTGGKLSGVPSGFAPIDRITHGWQKTDLIILAARPAVGKTAFALNLARNAAKAGVAVGFFSLEMSAQQLTLRLMSAESEIPLEKIKKSHLDDPEMKMLFERAVRPLSGAQIFIDDTATMNVFELRAKARRMVQKDKVGFILIDYLQLMSGTTSNSQRNREQEISEISRNLKQLAKELEIPIIALCQLSRAIENRANKKGQLSDLRESGAIEQDADTVIFLSRPEYYAIHRNAEGESTAGETIVDFAKNRNGAIESCKLRSQLWIQKFIEYEELKGLDATKEKLKKDGVTQTFVPFADKDQVDNEDTTFNK